ncbi:MAG: hypothetical protein AB7P00_40835 [Sandaracinaceae bacterium]
MSRASSVAIGLGVSLAALGAAVAAASWSHGSASRARFVPPAVPDDAITALAIDDPEDHWARAGYVELVPPMLAPTRRDGGSRIEVWLRIPSGARVDVDPQGGLRLPEGAEADRVERLRAGGRFVVGDVRGAAMGADGQRRLRLLRPEHPGPGARLVGYAWQEERDDLGRFAHRALADLMRAGGGTAETFDPQARERAADLLAARSDCVACHARGRDARTFAHEGAPFRATDADGWYTMQAVLTDAAPLERYRPLERNLDRPFVTVTCPNGGLGAPDGLARCADGAIPVGRYDVRAARRADDPHAARVCASRRYLWERMTAAARERYADAASACGL